MPDSTLPPPPIDPAVTMRGLDYMPLYIDRLIRSRSWRRCTLRPALAFYMLNLWMAAFFEEPAASVADDDADLCAISGCPAPDWPEVRGLVLGDWLRCADGRLYHPALVEIAVEVWQSRSDAIKRRASDRQRKQALRDVQRMSAGIPADKPGCPEMSSGCPENSALKVREGKGSIREGKKEKVDTSVSTKKTPDVLGTRLPEVWPLTADMLDWAAEQLQAGPAIVIHETEKFVDYWHARPGPAARKLDWLGTWRNWLRKAMEEGHGTGARGNGPAAYDTRMPFRGV